MFTNNWVGCQVAGTIFFDLPPCQVTRGQTCARSLEHLFLTSPPPHQVVLALPGTRTPARLFGEVERGGLPLFSFFLFLKKHLDTNYKLAIRKHSIFTRMTIFDVHFFLNTPKRNNPACIFQKKTQKSTHIYC